METLLVFVPLFNTQRIPEMRMPSLASSRLALCVGTNKACFLLLPTPEGFTKLGNVFLMLSVWEAALWTTVRGNSS